MSPERQKRLYFALASLLAASVLAAVISIGIERLRAAEEKGRQYSLQIARLRQSLQMQSESALLLRQLKERLSSAKARFYSAGEIDPYSFGTIVRKRLASYGISVVRYQVVELKGQSGLEFSVAGSVHSLILFLKEVSESKKYWNISSLALTMREGTRAVEAVFRIGYEELAF